MIKGRKEKAGRGRNRGCATFGMAELTLLGQNHTLWTKCNDNCLKALKGEQSRFIVGN